MTSIATGVRIAIGQLKMCWTGDENTAAIQRAIHRAADEGAAICVFPELAVTGFHRQIRAQAQPALVQASMDMIRTTCAKRAIAVALGAPTFGDDGQIFNCHIHIDERGVVGASVPKIGLTESEMTFFTAGQTRPSSLMQGVRCSSVLCREVEDLESIQHQLPAAAVELIFWPSLVGRPPADPPDPAEVNFLPLAQALAKQSRAYVVQSNWPNSLNYPEEGSHAGESVVISPDGEALLTLPRAEAGLAVLDLGERRYAWFPELN